MSRRIELGIILNAVDKVSAPIAGIGRALARIARMTGLDKVARGVGAFGRQAWRVGRVAAPALAIAAGGLVGRLIQVGDQTAKTADKLGLGVDALQRLRYAGERTGVATGTMDMALQRFTRRAEEAARGTGEAKDALEYLGIELRDSDGKMRPTEDLMHDVADAMAAIEDPSQRVALAFKLFDSEGVSLVNTLAGGSQALKDMGAEATRMGLLTEEQARAAERASDNWGRLTSVIGQLGLAIGAQLLPIVDDWMVSVREFLVENREAAVALTRGFIARMGKASETVLGWIRGLRGLPARARTLWADVTGVFAADGLLSRLTGVDVAGKVLGWLDGLDVRISQRLTTLFSGVTVGGAMTALSDSLSDPVALAGVATALLASLTAAIGDVDWRSLGTRIGEAVGDAIGAVARGLGALLAPLFKTAADEGIGAAMGDVIKGLGDLYVTYLRAVADLLIGFLEGVFQSELGTVWSDIWGGLKDMMRDLLPGPVARYLLDSDAAQAPAPGQSVTPAPVQSVGQVARGEQATAVDGEVRVRITDESGRARVDSVTSESGVVQADLESGYAWADAAA